MIQTPPSDTVRRPHPARYSPEVLEAFAEWIGPGEWVLDPMAGTGLIHDLADDLGAISIGVELEPEWAVWHHRTFVGNCLDLPAWWYDHWDVVAVSVTYANRMADHHEAKDACSLCKGEGKVLLKVQPTTEAEVSKVCSKCQGSGRSPRRSYRHFLDRMPSPGSSAVLQWGDAYRLFEVEFLRQVLRLLRPGGRLLLNISNHQRKLQEVRVVEWHLEAALGLGFRLDAIEPIVTKRFKMGENHAARAAFEYLLVLRRP